ncbi:hypothetical protein G4G27_15105 [Sphingomonas sp. So64.6b]|uniref:hypothetical protein n=1 Tax=Sphingomonas sp. So64.6b TaxID=2997354 RepID=UPI0016020DF4|nr:hypothetical protein [Sphingomonas sp. So64.6b]QNA85177.1 hypothetical protein G4G27_15105 [Sphingomonas sp. So64.6b]
MMEKSNYDPRDTASSKVLAMTPEEMENIKEYAAVYLSGDSKIVEVIVTDRMFQLEGIPPLRVDRVIARTDRLIFNYLEQNAGCAVAVKHRNGPRDFTSGFPGKGGIGYKKLPPGTVYLTLFSGEMGALIESPRVYTEPRLQLAGSPDDLGSMFLDLNVIAPGDIAAREDIPEPEDLFLTVRGRLNALIARLSRGK